MTRRPLGMLKMAAGLGSLLACGAATAVVATDTKPASAPLRPPVNPAAPLAASSLTIPVTPFCSGGTSVATSPAPSSGAGVNPAVLAAAAQVRKARSAADRQAALAALTPDQRMQVTALLQRRRGPGAKRQCVAGTGGGGTPIVPGVVDATGAGPSITDTYVS